MTDQVIANNRAKLSQYIKNVKSSFLPTSLKQQLIQKKINDYLSITNYIQTNSKASVRYSVKPVVTNTKPNTTNTFVKTSVPTKYALLVGINYKGTSRKLDGCINDVTNMKNLLTNKCGFQDKNIIFITDDTSIKPTKTNILNNLTKLIKNAKSGDTLFFGYSGHGTNSINLNKTELSGKDQFLVPLDGLSLSTYIKDDEINTIIRTNIVDGVKMFGLIDACYSGTVFDLKYNYMTDNTTNNSINTFSITSNPKINPIGKGQVFMLSGSTDLQTSADAAIISNGVKTYTGALTYSFLRIIEQKGITINFKDLLTNMRTFLSQNRFTQIPQISSDTFVDISAVSLNQYLSN